MPDEMINKAIAICRKHGVTKLILFGSAVNNLENAKDLDLAVEGIEGWGLIELAAEIENNLVINVDVVPIKGNYRFINHILPRSRVLYA
jgi:predicted nucleotidyltransferase